MRNILILAVIVGCIATFNTLSRGILAAEPGERMVSHDVYFALNDNSPQAKERLVAACKKYLSDHPGTVWFAAGPLAADIKGGMNDQDFDVALHLVFENKAALDRYAKAEKHLKFIEENKADWKKVRVLDSYVDASAHGSVETMPGQPARSKKLGVKGRFERQAR